MLIAAIIRYAITLRCAYADYAAMSMLTVTFRHSRHYAFHAMLAFSAMPLFRHDVALHYVFRGHYTAAVAIAFTLLLMPL